MKIKIIDNRIGSIWPLPEYATKQSAGIDLRACIKEKCRLIPNETLLISTGIAFQPDNDNYAMLILPRSSLGHKYKIMVSNSPGLVDNDYRGVVYVSLWNRGDEVYPIKPGDKIAQAIFVNITKPEFTIVDELNDTERGIGGFGSTGT